MGCTPQAVVTIRHAPHDRLGTASVFVDTMDATIHPLSAGCTVSLPGVVVAPSIVTEMAVFGL